MPGQPALYATTQAFLDYFSLRSLSDLPPISEIENLVTRENETEESTQESIEDDLIDQISLIEDPPIEQLKDN